MTSPVVDVHAHAMPMPLLRHLQAHGLADLSEVDPQAPSGVVRIDPRISGVAPGAPLPLSRSQWDSQARLLEMDRQGVTHHAVSLPPFLAASMCTDEELAMGVVSAGNDALFEFVSQAPDRLLPLTTAPVGTPAAATEAQRCLDLGARGMAVGTRGAGKELDAEVNAPLWRLLHERRVFTFLHPSGVPDLHRLTDFYLPQLLGYPMETAVAVARLAFAGVLQDSPFPLCLAHGGGCLPWLRGRLDLGWQRKEVAHTTARMPSEFVRELYYDTAVFSDEVLAHLVQDMGVERILLGTDFPFELSDTDPLGTVSALGLQRTDSERVRWRTAAALLRIEAPAG